VGLAAIAGTSLLGGVESIAADLVVGAWDLGYMPQILREIGVVGVKQRF
jgi:hypothetical protein